MSKTIEQRAEHRLKNEAPDYCKNSGLTENSYIRGYKDGAAEQRAIDYAKACNALCKFHCGEKKGCMCEDLCIFSTLLTEGEE